MPLTHMQWIDDFVGRQHYTTTVFMLGSFEDHPAVVTRNRVYNQTILWAPTGKKGKIENHVYHPDKLGPLQGDALLP